MAVSAVVDVDGGGALPEKRGGAGEFTLSADLGRTHTADRGAGPTDTQVWNWAECAVLSGYGPAASNFA
ncbi:hypothetical protein ACWD5V_28600 [Streptomyces sp. NPDC002523]